MEKLKVRIICLNCLYSKKLDVVSSDPKETRLITSESCNECGAEGEGLRYFDNSMRELGGVEHTQFGTKDKELAELKEKLRWVPVGERLPEFLEPVETKSEKGDIRILHLEDYEGNNEWYSDASDVNYPETTHWRYIPEINK